MATDHRPEDGSATITAIIPHYGDPSLASALVGRLQRQHTRHQIRIVVVDDCSPVPFPATDGVEVIRLDRNRGFGSAVNTGARAATSDLLVILNSDLSPEPDFIDELVAAAAPFQPALCTPGLIEHDVRAQPAYLFPTAWRWAVLSTRVAQRRGDDGLPRAWRNSDPAATVGTDVVTEWAAGACLVVPREVFESVGGFDESFFMYGEDVDLCRRLRDRGIPTVSLGTVSVAHQLSGSTDPNDIGPWTTAARFRYARKWGFGRRYAAASGVVVLANFADGVVAKARGRQVHPLARLRHDVRALRQAVTETHADRANP